MKCPRINIHRDRSQSMLAAICLVLCIACDQSIMDSPSYSPPAMTEESLTDRLLGGLLGTAAGDAMGAPTEMWSREAIQAEYGHVDSLDDMVREPSAEGTWRMNLPKGGTTDDTRWKQLVIQVLTNPQADSPAIDMASAIIAEHDAAILRMKDGNTLDSEYYADQLRQAQWLAEWVNVARPYVAGDWHRYEEALHKFYGGEMVCAGMIYAPAVGLRYPGDPMKAYSVAYQTDIYDLGYARDMAGLMAAMVAAAADSAATPDSVLAVIRTVDPKGYFSSRLVGRTAYKLYQTALAINRLARDVDVEDFFASRPAVALQLPTDSLEQRLKYASWSTAYELLDEQLRRMPFHPDEVWLVTLTGMLMGDFELQATLEFIVNFGRDNDTSAAMAGAILGAMHGAEAIPPSWREDILNASQPLGLDFPDLTSQLVEVIMDGSVQGGDSQ